MGRGATGRQAGQGIWGAPVAPSMVGWDAADWKVIDPLLAKGEMPHLAGYRERRQREYRHPASAAQPHAVDLIATGKRPAKHGILGFTEPTADGLAVGPSAISAAGPKRSGTSSTRMGSAASWSAGGHRIRPSRFTARWFRICFPEGRTGPRAPMARGTVSPGRDGGTARRTARPPVK